MLLQKPEDTNAPSRQQQQRCERFAAGTADAIGAAGPCLFSLLPYQERARLAASWYDACAQAMLRGYFASLDEWIRRQACLTADENFEMEDLLQLLRICRRSAIAIDGWDEDVFSALDDVINEGLLAIRTKVSWNIPDDLNYLKETQGNRAIQKKLNMSDPLARTRIRESERRVSSRNRLALPIRVRCATEQGQREETARTQNVSLSGLYFRTQESYKVGSNLRITYPYWTGPGSINKEYAARVSRLDRLPDGSWGVAVEFLQGLRHRTR